MKIQVLETFFDIEANVLRKQGDTFDADQKRFDEISGKIPGSVKVKEPKRAPKKDKAEK